MSGVVIFGSGFVARPAIRALLEAGQSVLVATDRTDVAEEMIAGHERGRVTRIDATDRAAVRATVREGDAVISLLPVAFHVRVAEACLAESRPFVTTSYVSEQMRALDGAARRAGLLFLNEIGADPGIDHMQAMRMIDRVRDEGGRVTGLRSLCGGIPAPEASHNPLRYKLSWSPRGVVLAGARSARYVEDGEVIHVPPFEIFDHPRAITVEPLGELESYPNGDSIRFEEEYGLTDLRTLFRGTLRWPGWCATWSALARLGWIDEAPDAALRGSTLAAEALRSAGGRDGEDPRSAAARALSLDEDDEVLTRLDWLGIFAESPVPDQARSRADLLVALLEEKLAYEEGEVDMLVLYHELEYRDASGGVRSVQATLRKRGIPGGDSAMSRSVGLPAAFAALRILDGTIRGSGVRIPVDREVYEPILADLARAGIEEEIRA